MRLLLWIVGIVALAVAVTLAARHNEGYLLLVLPPWRVEFSLNFLVAALALAFAAGYAVVRFLAATMTRFWEEFPKAIEAGENGLVLRLLPRRTPVGFCGLRHFGEPPQDVEILYGLLPAHWGRGLATEAARAVLDHGFSRGLPRIFAGADSPNAASFQVMARLGMRHHGTRVLNGVEAVYHSLDARDPSAIMPSS